MIFLNRLKTLTQCIFNKPSETKQVYASVFAYDNYASCTLIKDDHAFDAKVHHIIVKILLVFLKYYQTKDLLLQNIN